MYTYRVGLCKNCDNGILVVNFYYRDNMRI